MNSQSLARGLAFFSVGLGLAELLVPKQLARLIGVDEDNDTLLRCLGARELGAGLGIMQGNTATFVWSRVAGDAMDLALLGAALRSRRHDRNRVIGAIATVAGVTAIDIAAGILLSRNPAQPAWRIARDDRGGFDRGDPVAMRRHADETMAAHQSGHLADGADAGQVDLRQETTAQALTQPTEKVYENNLAPMEAREEAAVREFGPGD